MLRQEVSRLQAVLEPAEATDPPVILAPRRVCNSEKRPDWADAEKSCSEAELAPDAHAPVPPCRLNSKAKKYEPLQAKSIRSDFDYQFFEVAMPGLTSSLRSNRFVERVDTNYSLNKVHLKVQNGFCYCEFLRTALLQVA